MDLVGLTGLTLYVVLFVVIFVESGIPVGFWLPGDTILFAAGLLAADPNTGVSVVVAAVGVTAAATAGAFVGYLTGARLGRSYLKRRYGPLLARAEVFYQRFGAVTLIAARFVPWLRTFAPVLAGAVAMPKRVFARAVAVGAVMWGTGLVLLGYAAADVPGLEDHAVLVAVTVVAGAAVSGLVAEWLRRRAASRPASPGASTASAVSTGASPRGTAPGEASARSGPTPRSVAADAE